MYSDIMSQFVYLKIGSKIDCVVVCSTYYNKLLYVCGGEG